MVFVVPGGIELGIRSSSITADMRRAMFVVRRNVSDTPIRIRH